MKKPVDYMSCGVHHPWHKMPPWKKRVNGFLSYQLASLLALVCPAAVDKSMYWALKDQFEDRPPPT